MTILLALTTVVIVGCAVDGQGILLSSGILALGDAARPFGGTVKFVGVNDDEVGAVLEVTKPSGWDHVRRQPRSTAVRVILRPAQETRINFGRGGIGVFQYDPFTNRVHWKMIPHPN